MTPAQLEATRMAEYDPDACSPELYGPGAHGLWDPVDAYPRTADGRAPWDVGAPPYLDGSGAVTSIEVSSPRITTTRGIRVGDNLARLKDAYGNALKESRQWDAPRSASRVFHVDEGAWSLVFEVHAHDWDGKPIPTKIWHMRTEPRAATHDTIWATDAGVGAC